MATLNIKGFADDLYAHLRERARRVYRSWTGEVVHLLSRLDQAKEEGAKQIKHHTKIRSTC